MPCNTDAPTPNLFFLIGNQRYGVPAQDLAWKEVDQSGEWCVSGVQVSLEPCQSRLGAFPSLTYL